MTQSTPTPTGKVLARVLLVSAIDGWSLIAIAVLGTLLALLLGDVSGAFLGLLIVAAGISELRGRGRLARRNTDGMRLLVRTQMFLLAVILVYCASRLGSFDEGLVQDVVKENLTPEMETLLQENGIGRGDILPAVKMMFYLIYGTVAFVSILCQGGLAYYYRSRTPRVAEALAAPPSINPQEPA